MRLSGLGPVFVLVVATGLSGCSNPGDQRFRASVGPVLKQCAGLNSQLSVGEQWGEDLQREAIRADAAIRRFRAAIGTLPRPSERQLRYLEFRLLAIYGSAKNLLAARVAAVDAQYNARFPGLAPGNRRIAVAQLSECMRQLSETTAQHGRAISYLIAAEHVVLGTHIVRDALEAAYPGGGQDQPGQRAKRHVSTSVEAERLVRSEIAAMRW